MCLSLIEHSHRRYNPLMDEYVLVCPHRLKRPWKGQQEEENSSDEEDGTKILNSLAPGGTRSNGTVSVLLQAYQQYYYSTTKDLSKERYNTHSKSCNSILYTKTNSATVYNVHSYQTMHF